MNNREEMQYRTINIQWTETEVTYNRNRNGDGMGSRKSKFGTKVTSKEKAMN